MTAEETAREARFRRWEADAIEYIRQTSFWPKDHKVHCFVVASEKAYQMGMADRPKHDRKVMR